MKIEESDFRKLRSWGLESESDFLLSRLMQRSQESESESPESYVIGGEESDLLKIEESESDFFPSNFAALLLTS